MRCVLLAVFFVSTGVCANDVALVGGRVMDPASGYDAIANVVIEGDRIIAVTADPVSAEREIDANGLVVAPGFIDLHAHGQDNVSNRFQAADGVTTALELEIGVYPVDEWYAHRVGNAVLNFGTSSGHPSSRGATVARESGGVLEGAYAQFSDAQITEMLALIEEGLDHGALGIGMGITYTPAADHREILRVFELAAAREIPVFVHMRNSSHMGGDLLAPVQEVLSNAVVSGASLHIVHINSSTNTAAETAVDMIRRVRERGFDVTTENYPYTAGSTRLESALFDDWTDYGSLQWVATGERLTEETFRRYRETGGWVIIHGRSEEQNAWLVAQPDLIIASDGIPFVDGLSHPRSAGTFARILGRYVREEGRLTLMQALRKMTIMPARRLEKFTPAMRTKGRLAVGMDADITVFDPANIADQATYTEPGRYSSGVEFVFVNGVAVIDEGRVKEDVFPGEAILAEVAAR